MTDEVDKQTGEVMTTAIVHRDPNSYLALQTSATVLRESGMFPALKNDASAYAVVQYGHELGVGPMMSLQNIQIIQGKPTCNGQLMLSLVMAAGVRTKIIESTDQICTIEFQRHGNIESVTFSIADAKDAGLVGKDNWKKYTKDMLFWRCVARGCRRVAPDAIMGLYTADEITDGEQTAFSEPTHGTMVVEIPGTTKRKPDPDPKPTADEIEIGKLSKLTQAELIQKVNNLVDKYSTATDSISETSDMLDRAVAAKVLGSLDYAECTELQLATFSVMLKKKIAKVTK